MVLIEIVYASEISAEWLKERFIPALRESVRKCAQVPGDDVEVRTRVFSSIDVHQYDLEIAVIAKYNPEQVKLLIPWQRSIANDVKAIVSRRISVQLWMHMPVGTSCTFSGVIDDCAIAKRLFATLDSGGGLEPDSEFWLRNHVSACREGCPALWEQARAELR